MKTWIATIALCLSATAAGAAPCQLPDRFQHTRVVEFESLQITLATDRAAYAPGDSIHCYLSIHNQGTTARTFGSSVAPIEAMILTEASCDSIEQTSCMDNSPFFYPEIVTYYGTSVTIQPDQCFTFQISWNGIDSYTDLPAPPGAYVMFGGLTGARGGNGIHFACPPGGVRLPLSISTPSAVPTSPVSWSRIKATYR